MDSRPLPQIAGYPTVIADGKIARQTISIMITWIGKRERINSTYNGASENAIITLNSHIITLNGAKRGKQSVHIPCPYTQCT